MDIWPQGLTKIIPTSISISNSTLHDKNRELEDKFFYTERELNKDLKNSNNCFEVLSRDVSKKSFECKNNAFVKIMETEVIPRVENPLETCLEQNETEHNTENDLEFIEVPIDNELDDSDGLSICFEMILETLIYEVLDD